MIAAARLLLVLAAVALSTPARAAAAVERFALVIGNNRAERDAETDLRYADDDAVATHRLLLDAGVASTLLVTLDPDSERLHADVTPAGPARAATLERAFEGLAAKMREAASRGSVTEFFLFYSGHGDVDRGEGFVVLEDGRLTRSVLFSLLSRSPAAQNHVFVDACRSYFLAFDRSPGGRRRSYTGTALAAGIPAELGNTGFVLSTSSDRESHEWERYQGGILSHELRSALRGAADIDLNGRISYRELAAFLTVANQAIQNPRFRPDFLVRAPANDLGREVLRWPASRAPLSFGDQHWGHFYVETARGDRVLDAHPAPGQALALWTPRERPLFVRRHDGRAEYVVTTAEPVEVAELSPRTPETRTRGALSLALEQIFTIPFGAGDVQRFRAAPRPAAPHDGAGERGGSSPLRTATGIVALTAGSAGVVLSAISLNAHLRGGDASQTETAATNDRVAALNRASIACYAGAALAGTLWAWSSLWPDGSVGVAPVQNAERLERGMTLEVRGRF